VSVRGARTTAEIVTLRQRFSPAQVVRRTRIRDAARRLASDGGYAAVTIDAVAARAHVARATVYRYFTSKDHLLSEVSVAWGAEIVQALAVDPPRGATVAARVGEVLARVVEVASGNVDLAAAVVAAATSSDPAVGDDDRQRQLAGVIGAYLDTASGGDDIDDRETVGIILGHVLLSVLLQLTTGRVGTERAAADVRAAATLMLGR
jgi:AcrR family transcriptional regulator